MSEARFDIEDQPSRLVVRLHGNFDQETAERLESELCPVVDGRPAGFNTLFDLCGMKGCSVFARSVLVRIQQHVAKRGKRTVWLANQARFRGLGLWVCHLAEDPESRAVVTLEAAEAWFDGTAPRDPLYVRRKEGQ